MARCAVPALVAHRIEAALAAHGFPAARVAGAELGLGHVRLTGVSLGEGLVLGALDIDAGISLLWRPRVHAVAIRGAELSAAALGHLAPRGTAEPAGDPPVDVVRIVDATLTLGDARLAVSGTIRIDDGALAGPAIDLIAASAALPLGPAVARGVHASIHASAHASIDASVDASIDARALQFDIRGVAQAEQLELADSAAHTLARGVEVPFAGRLAVIDGAVRATPHRPVIATARSVAIQSPPAGPDAPAGSVAIALTGPALAAFDADRPIALDARLALPGALRWSASAARIGSAELRAPSGTLVGRRTLRWRAAEARWAGIRVREPAGTVELGAPGARGAATRHTATWTAITGPGPIELGAGALRAHHARAGWSLDAGRAHALGGELVAEPAAAGPDRPLDLVIHARDVDLHRVLGALARGRADGTGALDGELVLRIAATGASLQRAVLRARPRGTLQLSDPVWRAEVAASAAGFALHQRIAATLADLEYLRLAAVLHPAGSDPDLQITVQGHGKQIAQDLDLTINLRGLRSAARRTATVPPPRPKP